MKNIEVKGAILEFMRGKCYAPLNAEALITEIPIEGPQLSEFWKSLLELEEMETSAKSALAEIARRAQHGEGDQ